MSTAYSFVGEWGDASGLLHLRARYYASSQGRFLSADSWPGDAYHPMSYNLWLYVYGNPVRFVDRTGHFPTEEEIKGSQAEFTCRCGWIDWNHVRKSDELTFSLLSNLKYASRNFHQDPTLTNDWGIYFGIPLGFRGVEVDVFSGTAVIPHNNLLEIDHTRLAASIFMSANEQFEELQGYFGGPLGLVGIDKLKASYYSEEDLSSDIMGFYIGAQRFNTLEQSSQLKERIRKLCNAVGLKASLEVFRESYGNGSKGLTNWRHWYPRAMHLTGCESGLCRTRTWPSEFSRLTSARINPSTNGAWRWYLSARDGGLVPTDRSGVFRLSNVLVPTPATLDTPLAP